MALFCARGMYINGRPQPASGGGGGGGLTADQHKVLRQLIHLADGSGPFEGFASGSYREIVGGLIPSSITWYTDNTKAKKIVEKILTRNVNNTPNTIRWQAFAEDGVTVMATVTDTITYTGIVEASRTRAVA